jgi:hypothetical protein
MDKFDKHLNDLYAVYSSNTVGATADEILSGVTKDIKLVDFSQRYTFGNELVDMLNDTWIKYGRKNNILIDAKLNRFFDFVADFEPELQIILVCKLLNYGVNLSNCDNYHILVLQLGEFFIY